LSRLRLAHGVYPGPEIRIRGAELDLGLLFLDALRSRALRVVRARLERSVPAATLNQRLAAHRARLVQHLGAFADLAVLADVGAVRALRVARAGEEWAEPPGPLHELPLPTLRAFFAGRLGLRLGGVALDVFAVGIPRAADEFAISARPLLERLAAHRAGFVEKLRLG